MYKILLLLVFISDLSLVCCASEDSKVFSVNFVFNGNLFTENVEPNRCSLLSLLDSVISRSSLPYTSVLDNPTHWTVFLNNNKFPTTGCNEKNGEEDLVDLKGDDYVYVFFNESGLNDLSYSGSYIKYVSKFFNQHVKSEREKLKKKKSGKGDGELANLLSSLLKSDNLNNLVKGFLSDGGKDALLSLFSALSHKSNTKSEGKKERKDKDGDHGKKVKGTLDKVERPLLDGKSESSGHKDTDDEL